PSSYCHDHSPVDLTYVRSAGLFPPYLKIGISYKVKKVRRNTAGKNKYAAGKQAFKARFPASFLNSASSFLSVVVKRYSAFLISAVLCTFRLLSGSARFHRPYIDSVHLDMIVHRDHQTLPPVNDPRLYKIRPVR